MLTQLAFISSSLKSWRSEWVGHLIGLCCSQLRIVAKFKAIRDLAAQDEEAGMWDDASSIRKLAMEIQAQLGAQAEPEPEGQDLGWKCWIKGKPLYVGLKFVKTIQSRDV